MGLGWGEVGLDNGGGCGGGVGSMMGEEGVSAGLADVAAWSCGLSRLVMHVIGMFRLGHTQECSDALCTLRSGFHVGRSSLQQ